MIDWGKLGGEKHGLLKAIFVLVETSWNTHVKTANMDIKTFEDTYKTILVPGSHGAMIGIHKDEALGSILWLCHKK